MAPLIHSHTTVKDIKGRVLVIALSTSSRAFSCHQNLRCLEDIKVSTFIFQDQCAELLLTGASIVVTRVRVLRVLFVIPPAVSFPLKSQDSPQSCKTCSNAEQLFASVRFPVSSIDSSRRSCCTIPCPATTSTARRMV